MLIARCFVLLLCSLGWTISFSSHEHHHVQFYGQENVTVFWINLDDNHDRHEYTAHLLDKLKFVHKRVPAVDATSPQFKAQLKQFEKPCKRNTDKDVAVIMSHLKAMYEAVFHDPQPWNEYALIIEDDVKFALGVNFTALITNHLQQPHFPPFGILQLSTSNPDAASHLWGQYQSTMTIWQSIIQMLGHNTKYTASHNEAMRSALDTAFWQYTHWTNTTRNGRAYYYWSAQAYIINKRVVKEFLHDVVRSPAEQTSIDTGTGTGTGTGIGGTTTITDGSTTTTTTDRVLEYHIVNSFYPQQCTRTRNRPCVLANCLFADTYIYAGAGPTYITSIPIVTGAKIGWNSTIHQNQVAEHKEGFQMIRSIVQQVRAMHSNHSTSTVGSSSSSSGSSPFYLPDFLIL